MRMHAQNPVRSNHYVDFYANHFLGFCNEFS